MGDRQRLNKHKVLISNEGLLAINKALIKNPFLTRQKIKADLQLVASKFSIGRAIRCLGWRKVPTKYCQIVDPRNQVKRFIYSCCCKMFNGTFQDTIDADETTIEVKFCSNSNWYKTSVELLGPSGGKLGKPKHNYKIHLFGGISRLGLTPL